MRELRSGRDMGEVMKLREVRDLREMSEVREVVEVKESSARLQVSAEEVARGSCGKAPLETISLSPFATHLVGGCGASLLVFDVKTSRLLQSIETGHSRLKTLCYSSDGMRVLSGGEEGKLRLWQIETDPKLAGTL
ncbi:MAG: hypothetical protein SGPRY_010810 [Prymnesium sp.]